MKARLIKLALSVLTSEKGRKAVGWILVAALSPLILIIAFLCALGSGEAAHNNNMVEACFYGVEISDKAPQELKAHVREMRSAFSLLDSAVSAANAEMEDGNSLDPIRVKAVFLALCYGESAPTSRAANRFVDCFYTTEEAMRTVEVEGEDGEITEEEESYVRTMPLPLRAAYGNVSSLLGREITEEDVSNISHIYLMIAGDMGDWEYDGDYSYLGGDYDTGWDLPPVAADPNKTAAGLVAYVTDAYESGWGYVWGTFGNVLTQSAFQSKLETRRASATMRTSFRSIGSDAAPQTAWDSSRATAGTIPTPRASSTAPTACRTSVPTRCTTRPPTPAPSAPSRRSRALPSGTTDTSGSTSATAK